MRHLGVFVLEQLEVRGLEVEFPEKQVGVQEASYIYYTILCTLDQLRLLTNKKTTIFADAAGEGCCWNFGIGEVRGGVGRGLRCAII